MTAPTLIHADDTPCDHGTNGAHADADGRWWCPDGQEITRIRWAGGDMTPQDATWLYSHLSAGLAKVAKLLGEALTAFARGLAANPVLRAAAEVEADRRRALEAGKTKR